MRIGFTGTMSVGKTTLVKALQEIPDLEDYIFTTERSQYLHSLGIPLNHETTIEGQTVFLAERVSELMQPNIVTDRTIIDVMAFTHCANRVSYMDGDAFEEYAKRFLSGYDYIFYVSPKGVEIEDNGVRETDATYREEIDRTIKQLLEKHRPVHYVVEGPTEERIKQILKIVKF